MANLLRKCEFRACPKACKQFVAKLLEAHARRHITPEWPTGCKNGAYDCGWPRCEGSVGVRKIPPRGLVGKVAARQGGLGVVTARRRESDGTLGKKGSPRGAFAEAGANCGLHRRTVATHAVTHVSGSARQDCVSNLRVRVVHHCIGPHVPRDRLTSPQAFACLLRLSASSCRAWSVCTQRVACGCAPNKGATDGSESDSRRDPTAVNTPGDSAGDRAQSIAESVHFSTRTQGAARMGWSGATHLWGCYFAFFSSFC